MIVGCQWRKAGSARVGRFILLVAGCMVGIFSMCYSVLGCFGFGVFLLVRLKSLFLG